VLRSAATFHDDDDRDDDDDDDESIKFMFAGLPVANSHGHATVTLW